MTSDHIRIHESFLSHQHSTLQERLPDGSSFIFKDVAIGRQAAVAIVEESTIRNGWWLHPQLGIRSNDVVIDVGSEFGQYTLTALAVGAAHVYAFEKNIELVRCIRENLRLNGHKFVEACSVINKTISPIAESLDHYFLNESSVFPTRIKWIKIDVGGQDEINVLRGAEKVIERSKPVSLLIHHYTRESYMNLESFLMSNALDSKTIAIPVKEVDPDDATEIITTTLIY